LRIDCIVKRLKQIERRNRKERPKKNRRKRDRKTPARGVKGKRERKWKVDSQCLVGLTHMRVQPKGERE